MATFDQRRRTQDALRSASNRISHITESHAVNSDPIFIQVRLKRNKESGILEMTESAQENLNHLSSIAAGSNAHRRRTTDSLPFKEKRSALKFYL